MQYQKDSLISYNEAAARLNVTRGTLTRFVKRGLISSVKLSARAVKFRESDIARYIETGSVEGTANG